MPFRLGIDLGTTYCALSVIDNRTGVPVILKNRRGLQVVPSAVYFKNGQYVAGLDAKQKFEEGDPNCAVFFKRFMGEKENCANKVCFVAERGTIYERGYTAVELSTLLLMHLKEEAEAVLNDTVSEVVITCPAYYYAAERDCIKRAANLAGLRVQEIIEEPTAAALANGLRNWQSGSQILVYDLGGGTFDVSVVEMDSRLRVKVKGTMGRKFLGGVDFDEALGKVVVRKLANAVGVDSSLASELEKTAIQTEMEQLKQQMTNTAESISFTGTIGGQSAMIEVTRADFEDECRYILDDTGILIDQLFAKFDDVRIETIADILLVGGSTYMPCVRDYLGRLFGKPPLTNINPITAVAVGAAIKTLDTGGLIRLIDDPLNEDNTARDNPVAQADGAVSAGNIKELTTERIVTHTLGIIAKNKEGTEYINQHIIPAGEYMPCKFARKFKFFTSKKQENEIEIYVLQGEGVKPPIGCHPQFRYLVRGIQHVPKGDTDGTIVRVQYSYDKSGLIYVQARQEVNKNNVDLHVDRSDVPDDMSKYYQEISTKEKTREINLDVVSKYKVITFKNVKWITYDNVKYHPPGLSNEPTNHTITDNEKDIEFHGYTVSEMNEGVYYMIGADNSFEIACNIDTSNIKPHPGGELKIKLGIITATLNQHGGSMKLSKKEIATVGSKFHLLMRVENGKQYEVYIDHKQVGSKEIESTGDIKVSFGFKHGSHCCSRISYAYISNIEMKQSGGDEDEDAPTDSWKAPWEDEDE